MGEPLTDEQLWGVPEDEQPKDEQLPVDWCPLRKRLCTFWDQQCRAEECVDI